MLPSPLSEHGRSPARRVLLASAAAVIVTLVCSCSKPPEPPPAPPTPTPRPTPVPTTPTPTPTPVPVGTPTPTPVPHHYAAEGTFFVTEEVTVRLKAGLLGVAPGTQVKLVKDKGDTVTVTDGTQQFDLQATQLTNDLDVADKIQKGTQSAEAAGVVFQRQQQAAYEQQQKAQIEFLRTHPLGGPSISGTPTPARR